MKNWAATALEAIAAEGRAAMVTLAAVEGSTPREAGARMIISATQAHGTVGGGNLEFLLIDQARRMLDSDVHLLQQDYPLGPLLAQCCGGRVRVLVERLEANGVVWLEQASEAEETGQPYTLIGTISNDRVVRSVSMGWSVTASEGSSVFDASGPAARRAAWSGIVEHIRPAARRLYIFGAGHVGSALVHIAETLPFRLHWYDTREELAGTDRRLIVQQDLLSVVADALPGSFFTILTHAHELDYQLTRAILRRGDAGYCGLIGSATKRGRFISRLAKDGVDVSGLTCPIGAGLVRSKLPAAIAVAASMELLARLEAVTDASDATDAPRQALA